MFMLSDSRPMPTCGMDLDIEDPGQGPAPLTEAVPMWSLWRQVPTRTAIECKEGVKVKLEGLSGSEEMHARQASPMTWHF